MMMLENNYRILQGARTTSARSASARGGATRGFGGLQRSCLERDG